ncbi:unnamed protein product [Phytophthora fragariaefolia]|uniref:Unnamed protein product n=1 Tax=Phytophthora fragariaefolia TaxID=1490495 RepID=A0A9W7D127_9STRA|nr:unnamed protein product [Phytophthora fragariaefolia]
MIKSFYGGFVFGGKPLAPPIKRAEQELQLTHTADQSLSGWCRAHASTPHFSQPNWSRADPTARHGSLDEDPPEEEPHPEGV